MFTSADINRMFREEVQKALQIGLPIPTEVHTMRPTLTRAKSFLGQCRSRWRCGNIEIVEIKLSKYFLAYDDDKQIRETIAHELCHTVAPLDGHGSMWRMYANKLNRAYGYHITRCASREESEKFKEVAEYVAPTKIYMVKCVGCGQTIKRARMSKIITHPEYFACGLCNGKFQRVA